MGDADERVVVGEGARTAPASDQLGLGYVRIDDADQLHAGEPGQDAGVLLPQVPHADDGHRDALHLSRASMLRLSDAPSVALPTTPSRRGHLPQGLDEYSVQLPSQLDVQGVPRAEADDVPVKVRANQ